MANIASQGDRKRLGGRSVASSAVRHRPGNPEIGSLIGHPRQLSEDAPRVGEGLINVPQRTGATDPRKMEIGRRLALRYVSGAIDADEEERHAPRMMALQGAQPVADRFKADAEQVTEQFDVVTTPLRLVEENGVRQNQRSGEIVRKPDAGEAARFVAGEFCLVDDRTYRRVQF